MAHNPGKGSFRMMLPPGGPLSSLILRMSSTEQLKRRSRREVSISSHSQSIVPLPLIVSSDMLPFTTKLLLFIFGLLAVATSLSAASALPGSELVARNPPKQHICQIVAVADVDVALAAVAASYGKSTDVQVAAFAELVAAIDICVDAIIELKAVIDLNVVVEATVALYVAIEAVLVEFNLVAIADIVAFVQLDVALKAILDAIVLVKVNANVDVGAAVNRLSVAVLQVYASIKTYVFLGGLNLSALIILILGLVGIIL
ncbi:hypothetical protein SISSUDRAFT_1102029 [Sistotremastrum suecicum HHB10207 ss-3]|uniref:Transmembrane protein n=1 Tax=Sistotremastrum suecicum HHB10207 ss-3 TaxID=1314776 RepID=A0A166DFB3_9AGAM|nr:hypothetical protein SISSUDRAFT_1102029 [Sistotremastrum suecicum HHB10207 ss-3]